MNIFNKLKEIKLSPINADKFYYQFNEDYIQTDYVEYNKMYDFTEISRYYFFDVSSFKSNHDPIKNIEFFDNFQDAFLSKIFFNAPSVLRYNLYMIFIVPNDFEINEEYQNNIDIIEHNLSFARKLFVNYDNIDIFFNYLNILEKSHHQRAYDSNKIRTVKKCIQTLNSLGIKSCMITKLDKDTAKIFLNSILSFEDKSISFDSKMEKSSMSWIKFYEKYYQINDSEYLEKFKLDHISLIKNKTFRKNVLKFDDIELKKFNVVCGKNATGKTSLLELIELTLTGKIHNTDEDNNYDNIVIWGKNGNEFTPKKSIEHEKTIKNMWYKGKVGSLNDLFCRINCFDINNAYHFALEFGREPYQKFLCDYQLLETRNNLYSYLRILNNAENNFSPFFEKLRNIGKYSLEEILIVLDNIEKYSKVINNCVKMIDNIIEEEISNNMEAINIIYQKLDSIYYNVIYDRNAKKLMIKNTVTNSLVGIDKISTAQRVCFALSIIFSQFFSASKAPKFILLDESVANFDSIHLLNLYDFLRELTINDVQIVFTTANNNIANTAKNKLIFLNDDFKIVNVDDKSV